MTTRILIVLAFLACSSVAHAQQNCSTGSYTYSDTRAAQSPCGGTIPSFVNLTDTRTASEWCTATMGANIPPGAQYWSGTSTAIGNGERQCPGFIGGGYVDCWPRMYFYEVDGGKPYPNGTTSDTSANRFFNQAYDHAMDGLTGACYEVPPPGVYSFQDFKQCVTQQCQLVTGGNCCQCSGPPINSSQKNFPGGGVLRNVLNNCCACSPIVIDVSGNGFVFTNAANGVKFDISGRGQPIQMAWTAPGAQNAFLCLPDANGTCDDGTDLFGSFSPQPSSSTPNGFAALAVYDQAASGGNGDGVIDAHDAIFSSLRLWIDANHDGISQPNEIFTLSQLGITSISLNYKADQRQDQYGNIFRYRSQITSTDGVGRMAYDVFFVTGGTTTANACTPPGIVRGKDGKLN